MATSVSFYTIRQKFQPACELQDGFYFQESRDSVVTVTIFHSVTALPRYPRNSRKPVTDSQLQIETSSSNKKKKSPKGTRKSSGKSPFGSRAPPPQHLLWREEHRTWDCSFPDSVPDGTGWGPLTCTCWWTQLFLFRTGDGVSR
ncbi:hypothetical protein CEXT_42201 [Caerostris extrusa]|uniref:Uncharacterized protein n=1 Tax=Caerostris extrusa TaxID=172846 RepID=A0AAV4PRK7_CAEEX|nr:hypothetical protein CEXT_42201 [Caerostris extrusa]